ncbi:Protein Mis18-alpha [Myotis davidii]|uniref:Protein Mis18-alpha n=1 Tax=Myotis davidii TaxID=225400 RepID=L5MKJ8_MYODS|nr:Protein Mis18-alpha [Myotis davidii]
MVRERRPSTCSLRLTPWCSYVLGSSEKQIVSDDQAFSLESRTEMENSLKQVTARALSEEPPSALPLVPASEAAMEEVLKILQTKLRDMETKLSLASSRSELRP